MYGLETTVFYSQVAIFVVDWRAVERIAHHLPPMLPAVVEEVVVVVVAPADMLRDGWCVVVIKRAALVLCSQIFKHHIAYPWKGLESNLCPYQEVAEFVQHELPLLLDIPVLARSIAIVIQKQHGGMVFEKVVAIKTQAPRRVVDADSHHVAPQQVAGRILICRLSHVRSARYECPVKILDAFSAFLHLQHSHVVFEIGRSAKLCRHFKPKFKCSGKFLLIADAQIARLAVIEDVVNIAVLSVYIP